MTKDEVIALAREAGLVYCAMDGWTSPTPENKYPEGVEQEPLERFAALVAAHERERILEMCKEGWWDGEGIRYHLEQQDAIRSRK